MDKVSATSFAHNHSVNKSFAHVMGLANSEQAKMKTEILTHVGS
jgi:hypothetical protein